MKKLIIWLTVIGILLLGLAAGAYAIAIYQISAFNQPVAQPKPVKIIPLPKANDVEASLNRFRVSKGLPVFNSEVPALDEAAQARAESMCAENNWSHNGDWEILDQYYVYEYAGENLYYGWLQEDQANAAVRDWSKSPGHLENMVGEYTEVGIGVKPCPGFQNGSTTIIITNYFGVPR